MTEMSFPSYEAAAGWAVSNKFYTKLAICQRLAGTPGVDETDSTILVGLATSTPKTAHLLLQREAEYVPFSQEAPDSTPSVKKAKKAKRKQVTT